MKHPQRFVEDDERAPRFLLSMRVKYAIGCACLFLAVALMVLSGLPHFVQALHGLGQSEALDDGGNVSGPELVWKLFEPHPLHMAKDIVQTEDGGFIIALEVNTPVLDSPSGPYQREVALWKIDSQGVKIWERSYRDNDEPTVNCITPSGGGGYVLAGDGWVQRIDGEGETLWSRTYEVRENDYLHREILGEPSSIVASGDGGYVVAGKTASYGFSGWVHIYLLGISGDGALLWAKTYEDNTGNWPSPLSTPGDETPSSVIRSGDGGFVVAGTSQGSAYVMKVDPDGDKIWEKTYPTDGGANSICRSDGGYVVTGASVLKIDEEGNKIWEKPYSGTTAARIHDGYIIANEETTYMLNEEGDKVWEKENLEGCHASRIVETDDYGFLSLNSISGDLHVWKTDASGEEVWDRVYGATWMVNDIALSDDGGVVVAGWTQIFGAGTRDAYLSKIDANGYRLWERSYGGAGWDSAECITQGGDGGFVVAGYSSSYGDGDRDVYILKIDSEGNRIWESAYGTPEQDSAIGVVPSDDGNFLVLGKTKSDIHDQIHTYLLKINSRGEKIWDMSYDRFPFFNKPSSIASVEDGGFILAGGWISLFRISRNGQVVWEKDYERLFTPCIAGSEDRYLVTSRYGPALMIDGAGNILWERNHTEELVDIYENAARAANSPWAGRPSGVGGEVLTSACDGGFILLCPVPGGDSILWRIDEDGGIIWATQLTDLSNQVSWSEIERLAWFDARGMVRGEDGTFVLAGQYTIHYTTESSLDPYVIKFRDPDLVGVECQETNPEPIAEPALLLIISTLILMPLLLLLVPGLLRRARARGT